MNANSPISVEAVTELLEKNKDKHPLNTINNAAIVFRNDPLFAGKLRQNLFRGRMELHGSFPWNRTGPDFSNDDDMNIRCYIEHTYHIGNEGKVRDAYRLVAAENGYHPVRDYLNSLEWDGVERIRFALHHFLGAATDDYTYESLKLFLLGGISRVFHPGCKFEYMPCLVGGQGAGKSTFIRMLASFDEWFCDDLKRLDDDRICERLGGHWILEVAEMLALYNVKCNEATKAFLSRQYDNYRVPYEKFSEDIPRQCVFAGTSNLINFLPCDRSGNRRFLPIMCDASKAEIHILENEEESRKYIKQLWAEAMVIYKSDNFKLKLPKEIEKNLVKYQEPFMQEDTFDNLITDFLETYKDDKVCTMQLVIEALKLTWRGKGFESGQVGEVMSRQPGWRRFNNPRYFPEPYGRQRGWERVTTNTDNKASENSFSKTEDNDNPFENAQLSMFQEIPNNDENKIKHFQDACCQPLLSDKHY